MNIVAQFRSQVPKAIENNLSHTEPKLWANLWCHQGHQQIIRGVIYVYTDIQDIYTLILPRLTNSSNPSTLHVGPPLCIGPHLGIKETFMCIEQQWKLLFSFDLSSQTHENPNLPSSNLIQTYQETYKHTLKGNHL